MISAAQRDELEVEIGKRMAVDQAPGSAGKYPIVSQYYDSPDRDCYWDKARRLKSRRKIRVRMYGSEDAQIPPAAFIEIKHKHTVAVPGTGIQIAAAAIGFNFRGQVSEYKEELSVGRSEGEGSGVARANRAGVRE